MKKSEYLNITSKFPDVIILKTQLKNINKQQTRVRRKLKNMEDKYRFLAGIVGIRSRTHLLVSALVKYFRELGFKVENVDNNYKEEDIRIWYEDRLIIVEVTGFQEHLAKDDKAHQISKHIPIRQRENKGLKVTGAFIASHSNEKSFESRNADAFSKKIRKIAQSHNYTLHTTVELLNYFIKIRLGEMSNKDLVEKLTTFTK